MIGFDEQFADLPDYILKCTAKIWEGRDIAALDWHYHDDHYQYTRAHVLPYDIILAPAHTL